MEAIRGSERQSKYWFGWEKESSLNQYLKYAQIAGEIFINSECFIARLFILKTAKLGYDK